MTHPDCMPPEVEPSELLQPGDPDFDAKYLVELQALVERQAKTIDGLAKCQNEHNATNREALKQRDEARARYEKAHADCLAMIETNDELTAELERVTRQRDAARARHLENVADLASLRARCERLEQLLGEMLDIADNAYALADTEEKHLDVGERVDEIRAELASKGKP